MVPKTEENKEFAKWLRGWIAVIQKSRASLERTLPRRQPTQTGREDSSGAHSSGPKLRAASGRCVG